MWDKFLKVIITWTCWILQKAATFLLWISEDGGATFSGSQEPDWTVIDENRVSAGYHSTSGGRPIRFEIEDLKCICLSSISEHSGINRLDQLPIPFLLIKLIDKCLPKTWWFYIGVTSDLFAEHAKMLGQKADPGRTCSVTFVQTDGTTHPSLIFPGGSTTGLLDALTQYLEMKRSLFSVLYLVCLPRFWTACINSGFRQVVPRRFHDFVRAEECPAQERSVREIAGRVASLPR